ncbi:uncharacterized protein LOC124173236 [Ischnura elegans]|uniref:uncharacterized protein LOC124173236 n=1 Tax=Ischnura elegans TaxID=197161 RepID=UPI001ED8924C|nr:uncharacterized protein LOC124173236 [Ischnura elegans]
MAWKKDEVEFLIQLVREQPTLYNVKDVNDKNKVLRTKEMEKVAQEIGAIRGPTQQRRSSGRSGMPSAQITWRRRGRWMPQRKVVQAPIRCEHPRYIISRPRSFWRRRLVLGPIPWS